MQRPKDTIIVEFEGPDKVGKQTQSRLFQKRLKYNENCKVILEEVPKNSLISGDQIYKWLDSGMSFKYPEAFQTLQLSNRLHVQKQISLYLSSFKSNNYIIFDRWIGSSYAYGFASGLTKEFIDDITAPLWKPDITFILFGDPHVGPEDEYERNSEFQRKVRDGYLEWISMYPKNKFLINANRDRQSVYEDITEKFKEFSNV